MSAAAVLAILVVASEAQTPEIAAALASASEVIGTDGAVRLVAAPRLSDPEALRLERELAVAVSVQVTWLDAGRLAARVRLHAVRTDRWIERELSFLSADRPAERGRALGFAIASMLPEGDPTLFATTAAPSMPPPELETLDRRALALAFLAGAGVRGPAGGLGATARGDLFLSRRLSIGASASARFGIIDVIDADTLTMSLGAGAAWWPVAPTAQSRFGLGLRAEALLLYQSVSHDRIEGGTQWKGHAFPGAAARLEGTCRVARPLELLVSAGTEVVFGTMDVTVAPPAVMAGSTTIPALRGLAEVGVRARF